MGVHKEREKEPLNVHNVWLLFDVYLFVVTNLKLCLVRGPHLGTKNNALIKWQRIEWVHVLVMAFLISCKEKNRLLLCILTVEVTYFTFCYILKSFFIKTSIINSAQHLRMSVFFPVYSLFIFYKYSAYIKWYMDQMIECKQWQNWKATLWKLAGAFHFREMKKSNRFHWKCVSWRLIFIFIRCQRHRSDHICFNFNFRTSNFNMNFMMEYFSFPVIAHHTQCDGWSYITTSNYREAEEKKW